MSDKPLICGDLSKVNINIIFNAIQGNNLPKRQAMVTVLLDDEEDDDEERMSCGWVFLTLIYNQFFTFPYLVVLSFFLCTSPRT